MSSDTTIFLPRPLHRGIWRWKRATWRAAELNAAIASFDFDLVVDDFDPVSQTGFVPCVMQGVQTGFEYYSDSIAAYLEAVAEMTNEPDFPYSPSDLQLVKSHSAVVQLVYSYPPRQRAASAVVAACLAALCDGTVLDEPAWAWYRGDAAIRWARAAVDLPDVE